MFYQSGFAMVLAWRQLFHEKSKAITALLGVMFAALLVFMQLGFRDSLFQSAANLPHHLQGDLFVVHPQTSVLFQGLSFPKHELLRTYAHPDVLDTTSVMLGVARWQNPDNKDLHTILVIGIEPSKPVICDLNPQDVSPLLHVRDTVLYDTLSKPDFGPIVSWLSQGRKVKVDINQSRVQVVGTMTLGASFAATGNLLTSQHTFCHSLIPSHPSHLVHIGIIKLDPKADVVKAKQDIQKMLDRRCQVLDKQELINNEQNYWKKRTSIGFTFGMGVAIGLVVGMVIVYQILYNDVRQRFAEYATLRSMGYSQGYLMMVVLTSAWWLAFFGFVPGVLSSKLLYAWASSKTGLPMIMTWSAIWGVWWLIFGMCVIAGWMAARQLKHIHPTRLFG